MLKELNSLAAGLLGLHGYPVQPLPASRASGSSGQARGSRQRAHPRAMSRIAGSGRTRNAFAPSASGHVYW
jgi:hypothetical protein